MGASPCGFKSHPRHMNRSANSAYVVGVAIGDGNLSNPNRRAVRLRITCDNKYPALRDRIVQSVQELFPENKVSLVFRKQNCTDISCYSNKWEHLLGWNALDGSKYRQRVRVPEWIIHNREYSLKCLQGLFETDGSVYKDRGYTYANFTTITPGLALDAQIMIRKIGYVSDTQYSFQKNGKRKYVIRVCKNCHSFLEETGITKK